MTELSYSCLAQPHPKAAALSCTSTVICIHNRIVVYRFDKTHPKAAALSCTSTGMVLLYVIDYRDAVLERAVDWPHVPDRRLYQHQTFSVVSLHDRIVVCRLAKYHPKTLQAY
ncbi:hypothetical protein J6590_017430 [Homalodisca vitripennis]|nr:hypothetical protein J6590_017430 [Homalodisca vitripennis]